MTLAQSPQSSSPESDHFQQSINLSTQPLTWLWPGRIPQGKLTLLDGAPGCGTTLFAVTLAACVSAGLPFPDGTPCTQGNVLLIAPHDHFRDTLLPRLKAAGARDGHVMSLSHVGDPSPTAPQQTHPFSLSHDLAFLESLITNMDIVLLILDPYTAIPGWRPALRALIDLAARTHCAILLTRSLSRAPADPLHPHGPASPVLTAARSHLLLAPDPSDEHHCLLLTPKHSLCAEPSILAYTITTTEQDIPILSWLPAPAPTHLRRLCTGPIRSLQRQAILHFLRERPDPCTIKDILHATSYDYEAGRKMLLRMQQAGELISLGRGLYTTANHPCLAHVTSNSQSSLPTSPVPVSNVPNNSSTPTEPSDGTPVGASAERSEARINPSCPAPIDRPPVGLNDAQTDLFTRLIASGEEALARVQARVLASSLQAPTLSISTVPCPDSNLATDIPITLPPQVVVPTSEKNTKPAPDIATASSISNERNDDKYIMAQSFTPWGMEDLSPGVF